MAGIESNLSNNSSASPPVSVLIPTYNRAEALMECLRHLEAQTLEGFEVVVVVDGSTDDSVARLAAFGKGRRFTLRWVVHPNGGASRARNVGMRLVEAPVCVLIGDDIFPQPTFLERHLNFHRLHPEIEAVALGLTRWCERGQRVTPFMRWLDRSGVQFEYGDLLDGVTPGWQHFYTSNLSYKTQLLLENPFNEGFPRCGVEDIELGYRLYRQGQLALYFLPEAVAEHLHPTDVRRTCRRAVANGESWFLFAQLWPEHQWPTPRKAWKQRLFQLAMEERIVLPLLRELASWMTSVWCPNPLLKRVLRVHEVKGYQRAALEQAGRDVRQKAGNAETAWGSDRPSSKSANRY
jgi:glycosyltransferase involved in cell wall biosynthesis